MKKTNLQPLPTPYGKVNEGPVWDFRTGIWYWVNILGKQLFMWNEESSYLKIFDLPSLVGAVFLTRIREEVLVALQDGIILMNTVSGEQTNLGRPAEMTDDFRFNDGRVDPLGNLWIGTMRASGPQATGSLYRFDGLTFKEMIPEVRTSNGLVFAQDRKTLFFIDTPKKEISRFRLNPDNLDIEEELAPINVSNLSGSPDGMTGDMAGRLWVAFWGGNSIRVFDSKSGNLIEEIVLPAYHVSSCEFGGKDMDELFITTADAGPPSEVRAKFPFGGHTFKIKRKDALGIRAVFFSSKS